jgi:cellulose synthase/poly-beta-1,6-N-acetylglucosamine synthase-like glycosyltransferase
MQPNRTAGQLLSRGQAALAATAAALVIADGFVLGPTALLRHLVVAIIAFYVVFVGLKLVVGVAGARFKFEQQTLPDSNSDDLPFYTVFVPMYDEASVLANLVSALGNLRYRTDRIHVMFLLEQHDKATLDAAKALNLPDHFEIVVVPPGGPKTKPNACNFAYDQMRQRQFDAAEVTGSVKHMCTIFDAEDRPEADHLLKAVATLWAAQAKNKMVACVQSILVFWNFDSASTSKYYWAEYVIHFRWMLPGFAKLGLIPPLGGTSNHFDVSALNQVADSNQPVSFMHDGWNVEYCGPWDGQNVTEDADLAARLRLLGYRVVMCSAETMEEAPDRFKVALGQRSRWLKGFMQTGLVHARQPFRTVRKMGLMPWACFELLMIGTPLSLMLNPLMWGLTVLYVVSRLTNLSTVTAYIEQLFYVPVFYAGVLVMVVGNLTLYLQKLATSIHQQNYGLAKWLVFMPLWWAFTSASAYKGFSELLRPSMRSHWVKTDHGHDQHRENEALAPVVIPATQIVSAPLPQPQEG